MKYPSALILCFAFVAAPIRAVIWPSILIRDSFEQVAEDSIVHWSPVTLNASLLITDAVNTADHVSIFGPDGSELPNSPYSQPQFWSANLDFNQRSEIPTGDYSFRFSGGSTDGLVLSYRVDTTLFPRPIPKLVPQSYRALFATPVSQPIRLVLQPFQPAHGTSSGEIFVSISGPKPNGWGTVLPAVHVDPHTPSVEIPANLLLPNVAYNLSIVYLTRGDEPTPDGEGYVTSYWSSLLVQFKTANEAPPAP